MKSTAVCKYSAFISFMDSFTFPSSPTTPTTSSSSNDETQELDLEDICDIELGDVASPQRDPASGIVTYTPISILDQSEEKIEVIEEEVVNEDDFLANAKSWTRHIEMPKYVHVHESVKFVYGPNFPRLPATIEVLKKHAEYLVNGTESVIDYSLPFLVRLSYLSERYPEIFEELVGQTNADRLRVVFVFSRVTQHDINRMKQGTFVRVDSQNAIGYGINNVLDRRDMIKFARIFLKRIEDGEAHSTEDWEKKETERNVQLGINVDGSKIKIESKEVEQEEEQEEMEEDGEVLSNRVNKRTLKKRSVEELDATVEAASMGKRSKKTCSKTCSNFCLGTVFRQLPVPVEKLISPPGSPIRNLIPFGSVTTPPPPPSKPRDPTRPHWNGTGRKLNFEDDE